MGKRPTGNPKITKILLILTTYATIRTLPWVDPQSSVITDIAYIIVSTLWLPRQRHYFMANKFSTKRKLFPSAKTLNRKRGISLFQLLLWVTFRIGYEWVNHYLFSGKKKIASLV